MEEFSDFLAALMFTAVVALITAYNCDMPMEKAELAQAICIKYNSKAVSFDRLEVTCENKAVIPLKEQ